MSFYTDEDGDTRGGRVVATIVLGIAALIFLISFAPFTMVGSGNRGVVTLFGKVHDNVLGEGLHLVNPLVSVHKISLQTQTIDETGDSSLAAASNDLQDVKMEVVANYHLPETAVVSVYQQYQGLRNFQQNKLEPTVREAVKSVAAQYTAEELVTKRSEVSTKIEAAITGEFQQLGVIEESFKIVNLTFSADFTKAIEAKVTAVQDAEAAKNKLVQVQYEAQQQVETAKAQAETIKIQAEAINSQGGADYVNLQAIQKWNGVLPTQMVPGSSVPFINVNK